MTVTASAPGKLLLLGEYAVLHGAPALVMAVDRRARVSLDPAPGYSVSAPHMPSPPARFSLDASGMPDWAIPGDEERFRLLDHFLRSRARLAPPFHAELDTGGFFHNAGGRTNKLGLGSSAALTVALAGAMNGYARIPCPAKNAMFEQLLEMHRALQGGRGSGFDVAAALYGGVIGFRVNGREAAIDALGLPDTIHTLCVWSGKSAATGELVGRVHAWRERDVRQAQALFDLMAETAQGGLEAARRGDTGALLTAVDGYADLLVRLGEASATDIVCAEHRHIREIAARTGAAYKPCGAGGGDVGMIFSDNMDLISNLQEQLEAAGFPVIPLEEDKKGIQINC